MEFIYLEVGIIALLLAIPLFFASGHLARALGIFVFAAGIAALLIYLPATSGIVDKVYAAASHAVE